MNRPIPNSNEIDVTPVDIVVSKADEAGDIIYANPIFYKLSGYSKKELNYAPHSILRHPDMPKIVFKYLWDTIQSGDEIQAFVKNMTKDGSFYWVLAHVRPANNPDGSLRNYVSTRKAMSKGARGVIEPFYQTLLEIEEREGLEGSLREMKRFLDGRPFNEVMLEIQAR